jgi:polyhydroxyalkanoate synthesis regulator protein
VSVIKINLEELYDALGGPDEAPARLLQRIVEFYGGKLILLVNVATDGDTEVFYAESEEVKEQFEELVMEVFSKWDGSNTPECWEELEHRLAAEFNAAVIDLYDGYDFAIAVAKRRGEDK